MVLNGMAREKDFLSSSVTPPSSSQEAGPPGPSVRSPLDKMGKVPTINPVTFVLCPHSVILWLGDLNYRIEELDVEKVKKLIEEKDFQTLYSYDQVQWPPVCSQAAVPTL